MSTTLSAIGSAALQLAAAPHGHASAYAEEGPQCGTVVPGHHPPHPHGEPGELPFCGTHVPGQHWPLPHGLGAVPSLLEKVALNPQPLPPREANGLAGSVRSSFEEDPCGNGRQVCPLPPPGPWPWNADLGGFINAAGR